MPRIPDQLLDAVVYLYPDREQAARGTAFGGTGFLVDAHDRRGERRRFVMTAGHVIRGGCRTIRVNGIGGGTEVETIPSAAWIHHRDGDDIAAAVLDGEFARWNVSALDWSNVAATPERLRDLNAGVGDDVFMLGRFVSQSGRQKNQPLARFGNIAMMPGERVLDGQGFRVEAFLVEMRSLSGFSGSPVFIYMGPGTYRGDGRMMPFYSETIGLIGIDIGHQVTQSDVQHRASGGVVDPDWVVSQNTGIAIVSPAWKISELFEEDASGS